MEEGYDYGKECCEVFIMGERNNTYFEENDFRRDPQNCLVYTNDDQMKNREVFCLTL